MSTLQEQYDSIVAQLDAFLGSDEIGSAIQCITSPNLEEKIKEIDPHWTGLREKGAVTLERLKRVVKTIRQGMFCKEGNLFYIRVVSMTREAGSSGEYLYPSQKTDDTFQYVVNDNDVYLVDIKDLSGQSDTPNLYMYDSGGARVTGYPNPFNLTVPRVQADKKPDGSPVDKFLAFGVRIYGFNVDIDDQQEVLVLKNDSNRPVLRLQFDHNSHSVGARHDVNFLLNALLETCL